MMIERLLRNETECMLLLEPAVQKGIKRREREKVSEAVPRIPVSVFVIALRVEGERNESEFSFHVSSS